jgi:hypothetical protein
LAETPASSPPSTARIASGGSASTSSQRHPTGRASRERNSRIPLAPSVAHVRATPTAPTPTTITGNIATDVVDRCAEPPSFGSPITTNATADSANAAAK